MAAYVIVQVEITDPVRYEEYRQLAGPTVLEYGGRFIVRGGRVQTLEGTWAPARIVVVEFPSAERAREWWASERYLPARELRQKAFSFPLFIEANY